MGRIAQQAKSVWGQVLPSFDKAESLRELIVAIRTAGMALEKDLWARGTNKGQTSSEELGREDIPTPQGSTPLIITKHALEDYDPPAETSASWQSWREFFTSPYFRRISVHNSLAHAESHIHHAHLYTSTINSHIQT